MKPTSIAPSILIKNQLHTQKSVDKKAFRRASRRAAKGIGMGNPKEIQGHVPSIELFQRENCPFSHAVRNRLTRLGLDFVAHTVPRGDALKHDRLVKAGGKDQIPFLIDHARGVKLYDSQAIITFLNKAYGREAPSLMGRLALDMEARLRSRADQIVWTLRKPYEMATGIRADMGSALVTVRHSFEFLRKKMIEAVPKSRQARSVVKTAPTHLNAKSQRAQSSKASRPINIVSMTEAA